MKKILTLFVFIFCISIYGTEFKNFIKNNNVVLVIKKIPVSVVYKEQKGHYIKYLFRYPFNEYHISENFNLLKIEYIPNEIEKYVYKNRGQLADGYFFKRYTNIEINKDLCEKMHEIFDEMKNLNTEQDKVNIYSNNLGLFVNREELANKNSTPPLSPKKGDVHEDIYFFINDNDKGAMLDFLYEIEIKIDNEELVFLLGSDPSFYDEKFQNLIKFINKITE
jgi:hypothetical protein